MCLSTMLQLTVAGLQALRMDKARTATHSSRDNKEPLLLHQVHYPITEDTFSQVKELFFQVRVLKNLEPASLVAASLPPLFFYHLKLGSSASTLLHNLDNLVPSFQRCISEHL